MLWSIIVGGFIGFLAGAITNKGGAMGIIANVVAGLVGSSVGQAIFGTDVYKRQDVDLAVAVNADGVHVGQEDMRLEDVRNLVGNKVVGISIQDRKSVV